MSSTIGDERERPLQLHKTSAFGERGSNMTTTGITPDAEWRNWEPTITTLRPATASTPKSEPGGEESFCTKANVEGIVGQSTPLQQVLRLVEMMANSDSTMLVLGETGTGKELIARAIHDRSRRKQRALVKQNCAPVP